MFWRLFPRYSLSAPLRKGYSNPFADAPLSRDLRKHIFYWQGTPLANVLSFIGYALSIRLFSNVCKMVYCTNFHPALCPFWRFDGEGIRIYPFVKVNRIPRPTGVFFGQFASTRIVYPATWYIILTNPKFWTQNSNPKIPNPKFWIQNLKFLTHLWYNISMGQE